MRRLHDMVLAATLVVYLLLVGCHEHSDIDDNGVVEVVVWAHEGQPAEKQAIIAIIDAFNRSHDDVSISLQFKQEQGYGERVNAAAMSGMLPDVLDIDGPYTAHFAELGILSPLDEYVSQSMRDDFLPTILAQGTYQGRLYTLGAFESTVVLFYNKTIFAACGIEDIPGSVSDAWTWEEFLAVLRKLKSCKPDLLPLETFMPWSGEWLTYAFMPVIWSNGGQILSENGKVANGFVNGDRSVQAMSQWQVLFKEGLSSKNATPGQFRDSKAAMAWGVFNRWPLYQDKGLEFGMVPLPKLSQPSSPSGSWCWGITQQSKDKHAAVAVLKWFVDSREGIIRICKANGGIPARESAIALMPDYVNSRELFIQQLRQSGMARPVTPKYGVLTKEMSRAMEDISRGMEVAPILNDVARRLDEVLSQD